MWSRQTYRLRELDFAANAKDGHGVDWTIRYRDIASWYDYVEKFIGISGEANVRHQIPLGDLQSGFSLNEPGLTLRHSCEKYFRDRKVSISRVAVLTRPACIGVEGGCT
jgi:choline dehydrogenase-like flavoprotein